MEIPLRAEDDGRSVTLHVGDEIVVVLEENATTGYRWVPTGIAAVVALATDRYLSSPPGQAPAPGVPSSDPVFGRGGYREFRLTATSPGADTFALVLKHEWEEDTVGIARWSVSIRVDAPS